MASCKSDEIEDTSEMENKLNLKRIKSAQA